MIKKVLLTIFITSCVALFTIIITFSILGRPFLVIDDEPEPSEAIIVLSGGEGRLSHALKWYEPGRVVILTNAVEPPTTKQHAVELGVRPSDVIEEKKATSTYSNATLSLEIMQEQDLESALVVTSDYHTRRTKMTFEKIYSSSGIQLSYAAAPSPFSTTGKMTRPDHMTAFSEYVKLSGYWLRLFVFHI
ncbi:YdcF family protein [Halobacillus litoralis]|uniref:YdcF family protein n=1 Tax=Halobacillus litoralis TaxID=45668 RepID=UPI001CD7EF27|nr:YdcF family protein [Halobacillus litoralis]MCA0971481.1 YdcF family protein [Halobacillus litoralis]